MVTFNTEMACVQYTEQYTQQVVMYGWDVPNSSRGLHMREGLGEVLVEIENFPEAFSARFVYPCGHATLSHGLCTVLNCTGCVSCTVNSDTL